MIEADIWRAIIGTLREGLDAQGHPGISIKQSFQPIKQGAASRDAVYLYKITSTRVGFQGAKNKFNAGNNNFDVEEGSFRASQFQLTAVINRDIQNEDSLTSFDVADLCADILQTRDVRRKLLADPAGKIGILRIGEVRNPYDINDKVQFQQDASFDFVLTYNQTITSTVPKADPIEGELHRV